jgi:hypothetical protein
MLKPPAFIYIACCLVEPTSCSFEGILREACGWKSPPIKLSAVLHEAPAMMPLRQRQAPTLME